MRIRKQNEFFRDCGAVSEIIGEMLLTAIVVILISSIAVFVYANLEVTDVPHTEIHERVMLASNTIEILHSGGEPIDVDAIKITLYVNGEKREFTYLDTEDVTVSSHNGVWKFGDSFTINTAIDANDTLDLYFVHTDSEQVIHKARLSDSWIS
ncbi:MAG: type IV pilin N-terminal domain-containing protein [Methanosarcinaceae archaeon]|nr:type IV pilin N-terminal domain-containing protein [Methanosarcinaceae archaeon]